MLQRRALRQLATGEGKMCFRGVPFDSWRQEKGICASEACPSTAGDKRREDVRQRRALRQLATGEGMMCFRGVPFDSWR